VNYLFDTDVISALMKGTGGELLARRLEAAIRDRQAISVITVFEIYYGAYRSRDPQRYISLFESEVMPSIDIIDFDENAARIAARIWAERERIGSPIAPADLQIAATALASGSILITGNTRHFEGIPGLDIENWLLTKN
jgi:predicted nucleic acid-binding protein